MKLLSLILFFLIITFQIGCAIGPRGSDLREYLKEPKFNHKLEGKIIVTDLTEYKKGSINFSDDIKNEILKEIRRGDKEFHESTTKGRTFHFKYHKCEEVGYFPTRFPPVNVLVAAVTLSIVPVGYKYACPVSLEIVDTNKNENNKFSIVQDSASESGFIFLFYLYDQSLRVDASWALPARRLLKMYEEKLNGSD